MNRNRPITTLKKNPINMICGLNMTSSHKAPKNPIVALLGEFGYSQNGGGTFSDFFIFFSPLLYVLITTSSSLKAVDKYPKSCPQVTQNHHFGSPLLIPWVSRRILLLFLGFEGPTKGMTTIWSHFVILVVCKLVIFKPQIMLSNS